MKNIVFLDRATIGSEISIPQPNFPHKWKNFNSCSQQDVLTKASQADYIVNNKVELNKDILSALPKLKHIAITATGTNCVDLKAAKTLGISVSNVPNYANTSVGEHALALMLCLNRQIIDYKQEITAGAWQQAGQFCFHLNPINDLANKTLGLIGTGAIAEHLANIASALGMRPIFHSVSGRQNFGAHKLVSLEHLLSHSDIVSVHCPLTEATSNLIDADAIKSMRKRALIINTARGSIVDLSALLTALKNKSIGGAGIDVAPEEPPSKDSPIMQLNRLNNCIVTPHTAWASTASMQTLMNQVVKNLNAINNNESLNVVN